MQGGLTVMGRAILGALLLLAVPAGASSVVKSKADCTEGSVKRLRSKDGKTQSDVCVTPERDEACRQQNGKDWTYDVKSRKCSRQSGEDVFNCFFGGIC